LVEDGEQMSLVTPLHLTVLAWAGLLVCFGVLGVALWMWFTVNGSLDPDKPIFTLLAASAIPGILWFLALIFGWTSTSDWSRAWSRVVLMVPYIAILIVIILRLIARHQFRERVKRRG
jgi:hypothetical protein